jgi:predicted SnoaL-like aldol condensation-catalyzing enzyme
MNGGTVSLKEAAVSFLRLVVEGKIRQAYATHVSPGMRHHNGAFAGDAESLERAMEESQAFYPRKSLEIRQVIAVGETVAVHSHLLLREAEPGLAVVHIFRFENGRIVEMWDIGQPIPERSPNSNGIF